MRKIQKEIKRTRVMTRDVADVLRLNAPLCGRERRKKPKNESYGEKERKKSRQRAKKVRCDEISLLCFFRQSFLQKVERKRWKHGS